MKPSLKNLFFISFVLKLILAWITPVTLDEYYYFIWGQYLSLSYFDHPPMVGWIMMLSQPLKTLGEGAIRWPFILFSHLTLLIWIQYLRAFVSSKALFWFLAIALLNPLWGLGAIVATPDIPLVFFWSLATLFSMRVLRDGKLSDYLGLGTALGLGFLSKYQIVLFLPCLLILIFQKRAFQKLLNLKALFSVIVATLLCLPVFYWNYTHDWASFSFQWKHGMAGKYWKWYFPLEYVGTQLLIIFPPFLYFVYKKSKACIKDPLFPFVIFPFAFFFYSSFKGRVEANWVIMALPPLYVLCIKHIEQKDFRWIKQSLCVWLLLLGLALASIPFSRTAPISRLNLYEAQKFEPLLGQIDLSQTYLTYSYQLSAFLTFKTGQLFCKLPKSGRIDHFHFIDQCHEFPEKFRFLTEDWSNPNFSELFPGYVETNEVSISPKFKYMSVEKR